MIKRRVFLTGVGLAVATAGCRGKHSEQEVKNEEPSGAARLMSQLKMEDQDASAQLIQGFYPPESGATWRWTAGKFAVVLKVPLGAAERGGTLSLKFSFPEPVFKKLGAVTLTAVAGTKKLRTETYPAAGPYTFTADLPPELLNKDSVTVDFVLDKSLPPGPVEKRELGIIATSVGLEVR